MGLSAVILLSIALATDAAAVTTANVLCANQKAHQRFYLMPLLFGLFQAGMTLLGLLIGGFLLSYLNVDDIAPYFVAVVFLILGVQMIREGLGKSQSAEKCISDMPFSMLLTQAFLTSIDALAAGLFLETYGGSWHHALVIGLITAFLVTLAILLAKKVKCFTQHYGPFIGGGILILLALYTAISTFINA